MEMKGSGCFLGSVLSFPEVVNLAVLTLSTLIIQQFAGISCKKIKINHASAFLKCGVNKK